MCRKIRRAQPLASGAGRLNLYMKKCWRCQEATACCWYRVLTVFEGGLLDYDPVGSYLLCSWGFAPRLESCWGASGTLKFLFGFALQAQRKLFPLQTVIKWTGSRPGFYQFAGQSGLGHAYHWSWRISSTRLLIPLFGAKFLLPNFPLAMGGLLGWVESGCGFFHCHLLLTFTISLLKELSTLFPIPLLLSSQYILWFLPHRSTDNALEKVSDNLHVTKPQNI